MNPIHHPACNDILRRPDGVPEEECGDLPILRSPDGVASFWQPEPIEAAAIFAGAPVLLSFGADTHPPVSVQVLKPTDEQAAAYKATVTSVESLQRIAKDFAALAAKRLPNNPTAKRLSDELLDVLGKKSTTNQTDETAK